MLADWIEEVADPIKMLDDRIDEVDDSIKMLDDWIDEVADPIKMLDGSIEEQDGTIDAHFLAKNAQKPKKRIPKRDDY